MALRLGRILAVTHHPAFHRRPVRTLARALRWAAHCAAGRTATARFRDPDYTLVLPPVWSGGGGSSAFVYREMHEPELALLPGFLGPGMVYVEGGASSGAYAFAAARLVGPEGRVLAFEPGQRNQVALEASKARNGFLHVSIRPEALGQEVGTLRLVRPHGQDNMLAVAPPGTPDAEIAFESPVTTITAALEADGLDRLDFVKLEIEGAEEAALRGAEPFLVKDRPVVLFSVNPRANARAGVEVDGAMRYLEGLGYRLRWFDPEAGKMVDGSEVPGTDRDLWAIPADQA